MKLDLNRDEAQVLINLLNVAVKSMGLDAAESSLHFVNKLKAADQEEQHLAASSEKEPTIPVIES